MVEATWDKYCSVAAMLKRTAEITHDITVSTEGSAAA